MQIVFFEKGLDMSLGRNTRRSLRASAPCFVQPACVREEVGGASVLECRVDGYPRPEIVWQRAGAPVARSRRVHIIRSGDRCLLHIKMPLSEAGGLYSCTATNIVGTATTQVRLLHTGSEEEKMNFLNSSKTNGIRSRMSAKSTESVSDAKPPHRSVFRMRSASGNRKQSCRGDSEDPPTVSARTKPTFTSHVVWHRADGPPPSSPAPIHQDKKQLSKSVEDCRRHRTRGFLNRVKIPDIFSKADSTPSKDVNGSSNKANSIWSKKVNGRVQSNKADPTLSKDVKGGAKSNKVDPPPSRDINGGVKFSKVDHPPSSDIIGGVKSNKVDPSLSRDINGGVKSSKVDLPPSSDIIGGVKSNKVDPTLSKDVNDGMKSNKVDLTPSIDVSDDPKFYKVELSMDVSDGGAKFYNVDSTPSKDTNVGVKSNEVDPIEQVEEGVKYNETATGQPLVEPQNGETPTNGEVEVPVQLSTRERIAAYLKRFESGSSASSKGKVSSKVVEKGPRGANGSAKKNVPEPKTPQRTSEDNNSFFGKFRRRKSSDNLKKNVVREVESSPKLNGSEIVESSEPVCPVENGVSVATSAMDIDGGDMCEETAVANGFLLSDNVSESNGSVTVDHISNGTDNDSCSLKQPIDSLDGDSDMGSYEHIDTNILNSFEEFTQALVIIEESKSEAESTDSITQITDTPVENVEENVSEFKENQVPIIHIELSQEDDLEVEENSSNGIRTRCEVIQEKSDKEIPDLFFKKAHKGKIKYSSPVIEEECEALLELQNAEEDHQRVSSPVHCPARILKGPQSVTVLRGESVTLAISFSGHPTPDVIWMKGGRVLSGGLGCRLSILEGREMSVVTVSDVTADDSGKYVVSVENEGGGDSCFASVAVVGFPEPPGGEPTANEVTDHSLVLSWYGSMYDGGSVVTGYQVEMCTPPDKKWHKVASSVNTSCVVLGLSKGQRYTFRVRAENRYGTSHPSKESKIIKLDDFLQDEFSEDEEPGENLANPVEVENGTNFTERFDLKEEVGKGRFGTVYRCVEKACGRPRAAKVIRCLKVKDKEKVRQEIEIMSRLHHPKLMQVLAAFESGRNMIMVMEFISGGELFERVIADDFVLTEQDCILFMRQICDGVAYMHRNNIIHLDLKPENILCKTRSSHKIKIIDFGLARVYNEDESLRVLFGTPEFVAPEVINYEPVCPGSDMWSLGVICYVLLSGLSPFMGDSDTETFANITRGDMDFDDEAFDEISQDAKDFISKLLVKTVKNRLSAEECLKHGWLATSGLVQKRPLSTEKLKRFIIRRKWQKSGNAIRALGRMVSLSRSSLGSSCDSYSPIGSPTSSRSRSRSSLLSRSETTDSAESDIFQDLPR